jgi:DNA-directed RNA polymerase specialized sigma subunit
MKVKIESVYQDPKTTDEERQVLDWSFEKHMTVGEMAQELGRTEGYVRKMRADLADRILRA